MNKKFMVVALMAALSTVATATIEDKVNANKVAIEKINGTVNELQDKVQEFDKNFATKGEVNDAYAKAEAVEKENVRVNKEQDAAIAGKVDKNEFYDKYNELHMGQTFTDETLKTHREQIEALDKNKVDKNTYEEDKKAQAETDKKQDQALKDEPTAREEADKVLGGRIDTLQQDFAKYDGRLSGLEKKVDNLDNKMNKGLSLMAAMNAVDFQNVQTGEMALGAGIGHYGNAQSVALGVAYSPVEDLTVNAKYSVTAGDVDSFALGAGATYKFKIGR